MIDYSKIQQSIEFYEKNKFVRIEVPWWVTQEIAGLTKPPESKDYILEDRHKVLVASAEQSFLYLSNKGQLPKGQFQATTPCFRDEPINLLHSKHFIKNELIKTDSINSKELKKIISLAKEFFSLYIKKERLKVIEEYSNNATVNFDIVVEVAGEDLELGSYGIRKCEILEWIYGTACAEPRLTRILNRIKMEK